MLECGGVRTGYHQPGSVPPQHPDRSLLQTSVSEDCDEAQMEIFSDDIIDLAGLPGQLQPGPAAVLHGPGPGHHQAQQQLPGGHLGGGNGRRSSGQL